MDAGDHDTSIDHDFFLQGLTGDYGPFDTSAAGDDGPDGEPPVGSHPDPGDAAGVPSSGSTSAHTLASSGSKRSRAGTSEVWQDFERIYKEEDGVSVRYAKCYICKNELSAKPSGGTGHLKRHAISCKRKSGAAMKQTVLQYNPDGSVHHWEYDSANARKELCRFIARADLPLNIGESAAFEDYIKQAHNPRFTHVSRQTTSRDMVKYYNTCRSKLKEMLQTCTFSVALTSDIWAGRAREDYLSVVAHFVNNDWKLEKRIICFRLIDNVHSGENIAEKISQVVADFGLTNKIFSITLDNAGANSRAMDILTPLFSTYAESFLLHQRCACHIINLIVKSGLKRLSRYLEDFRTAISFVNSSNQRIAAYKQYCVAMGVRPRKFALDMPVRWNSTFLMLKNIIPYKSTFGVFIHTHYHQHGGQTLLTEAHWYVAERILEFLEFFYDSTVSLSGVYYPTSCLVVHNIVEIATHLNNYENDNLLRDCVVPMKSKFLKYWKEIPLLYAFAFILDPRAKIAAFCRVLAILGDALSHDYSNYYTNVRSKLFEVYSKYETKYGGVRLQRPPLAPTTSKKTTTWGKIFGAGSSSRSSDSSSRSSTGTGIPTSGGELTTFIDSDVISHEQENFNILQWWHEHKTNYPVLSLLARDLLTVPVSTVSSEAAFSLTGRIIEERRTNLSSEMVEILTIVKDWEQAEARMQHTAENTELEESFQNLYLDADENV
jgi:hypothetical protein